MFSFNPYYVLLYFHIFRNFSNSCYAFVQGMDKLNITTFSSESLCSYVSDHVESNSKLRDFSYDEDVMVAGFINQLRFLYKRV